MDMHKMTDTDFDELMRSVQEEHERRREVRLEGLRNDILTQIEVSDFDFKDVFPQIANKPKKKVPIKYRNPDKFAQTWTGRGRTPKWVLSKLESGADLNEFLVE